MICINVSCALVSHRIGTYIGFHITYCCISKRWHQKRIFWHENRFCYYAFPNHFCFPKVVTVWFMILINQRLFHSNKTYSFGKSFILFEHPPFLIWYIKRGTLRWYKIWISSFNFKRDLKHVYYIFMVS